MFYPRSVFREQSRCSFRQQFAIEIDQLLDHGIRTEPGLHRALGQGAHAPRTRGIAQEVEKSQWIQIAMDQLLGPDTGRVFNDACADIAAGNMTAEQAANAIEKSWQQNKQ